MADTTPLDGLHSLQGSSPEPRYCLIDVHMLYEADFQGSMMIRVFHEKHVFPTTTKSTTHDASAWGLV